MSFDSYRPWISAAVLAASVALATSACASDGTPTGSPTASAEPTTTASASASALPGEPIDIGPGEGDILSVVGVEHDGVLTVHSTPGPDEDVVARLDPLAEDVVALGEAWALDDSIWYRVSVDGESGWVNSTFVQYKGGVEDITAIVVSESGATPQATTMTELGLMVAQDLASVDPPSRITMAAPASLGDVGEVTYDVVGIGDDSVGGFRLQVIGTPDESGFVLKTVEQTLWCLRGVDGGVCV